MIVLLDTTRGHFADTLPIQSLPTQQKQPFRVNAKYTKKTKARFIRHLIPGLETENAVFLQLQGSFVQ